MKFFYHPPARIVECVSEYTFSVLQNIKQTNKQKNKKQESKTAKKAQEEKIISLENLLKNKFAAAREINFLATRISINKSNSFSLSIPEKTHSEWDYGNFFCM